MPALVRLHYTDDTFGSIGEASQRWLSDVEIAAPSGWAASKLTTPDFFHVFAVPPLSPMYLQKRGFDPGSYTLPAASLAVFIGLNYGEGRSQGRIIGTGTSATVVTSKYVGGSLTVQRGIFVGENFARIAYAWLTLLPDGTFSQEFYLSDPLDPTTWPVNNGNVGTEPIAWADDAAHKIVGLGQRIFDRTFGLLLVRWSANKELVEAVYLENVMITGQSRGITPGATFEVEGLNMSFTRLVPARGLVVEATAP